MKKIFMASVALTVLAVSITLFQISSCKKVDAQTPCAPVACTPVPCTAVPCIPAPVCDVKSTYTGTSTTSGGVGSVLSYQLKENNLAIGLSSAGVPVTFGGYRNTCDSVVLSVYYTTNSSYYLLEGKLENDKATISGTFKNLTTPSDFGTFTISK
jgi:hypothetical protein